MSSIITNAIRYNTGNTFRSDSTGSSRGNARGSNGAAIGFDCSGLVYNAMRNAGYYLPGTSAASFTTSPLDLRQNVLYAWEKAYTGPLTWRGVSRTVEHERVSPGPTRPRFALTGSVSK